MVEDKGLTLASQDQPPEGADAARQEDARLAGYVDAIVSGRIYGWAWDASHPERSVVVEIRNGDRLIGTAEASRFREDLQKLGVGDGRHAFEFDLPEDCRDPPPAGLSIVFQQSGTELGRNLQLTLVSGEGGAAEGDQGEASGSAAVRMRRMEDHLAKILNMTLSMHGQLVEQRGMIEALNKGVSSGTLERRLEASFLAVNRRLDELAKSMAGAEGFLLRTDERLRELSEKAGPGDSEPALRREIRGMGVILLCAILAVMTMLLA